MSVEQRYVPNDECPLFSPSLEEHIVGYTRGTTPNRGTFCGNCYTPLSRDSSRCFHCSVQTDERPSVDQVPEEVIEMLRQQRSTESTIVNAFAYAGFIIAILSGLAVVLGIPYLRAHLLPATVVYTLWLLIGGRTLAAILGGYYGDKIAYDRARNALRARWAGWLNERG